MFKIKNYTYKIRLIFLITGGIIILQSFNSSAFSQNISKQKISNQIKSAEAKYINKKIFLRWRILVGNNIYSFKVLREDNLNGQYINLNVKPQVNTIKDSTYIIIVDSLVNYRNIYRYYAVLNDTTGHQKSVSDTMMAAAYDLSDVFQPLYIKAIGLDSLGAIKVQWKLASPQNILTLKIYRSENYDSNYVELTEVSNTDSVYIDRTAEPVKKYFYFLVMTDPFGNSSFRSAKIFGFYKSSIPPLPPYDLIGEGTRNGIKLLWTKPSDHIQNYNVYRDDGVNEDLSLLTTIKSTDSSIIYYDSSNALKGDRAYGYSIRSENTSGVLSQFSDTFYVKPNIEVSLKPPLELRGYSRDSIVQLYWQNLYASLPTLDGYKIYRKSVSSKTKDTEEFKPVVDSLFPANQNSYIDSTIKIGADYEYAVQAVDIYGNKSQLSSSILIKSNSISVLPPAGIKAQRTETGILITWDNGFQKNINQYKIYRYERGNKPVLVSSIAAKGKLEYKDVNIKKGNLYFYYLSSVDTENNESLPSHEVGIRY